MDLYCPKCGEPWEHDALHDEATEGRPYAKVAADFRKHGCMALGQSHGPINPDRATIAAAAYELSGDDMDGAAADMEDFGL